MMWRNVVMEDTKRHQKALLFGKGRGVLVLLMALLFGGVVTAGCSCDPPQKDTLTIVGVKIEAPASGSIYNETNDVDKQLPGVQINVKVTLQTEGTGDFPENIKVTLTTNSKREASVTANGTDINYEKYTLEEGANTLQATVTLPDGKQINSSTVQVTSDSQCYQISIVTPTKDAVLGVRDDENTTKDGFQQTVIVKVDKNAVEPVTLTIKGENGESSTETGKPFDGEVAFTEVTLPVGKVALTASIKDAAGNECSATSNLTVQLGAPAVDITSPTEGKQLCPADDADAQASGFQVDVAIKTSAADQSEATLYLDGLKNKGPVVVSGGVATFRISLPDLQSITSGKVKVEVKDPLGNVGSSKELTINARVRGYEVSFLNIISDQTITEARDEDKNQPGIQFTVRVATNAPDGTTHEFDFDGQKLSAKSTGGTADFLVTLKDGKNCFEAKAQEPTCKIDSTSPKTCINVQPPGVPSLACNLSEKNAPAFSGTPKTVSLSSTHDADTQAVGVQNTLFCQSDAEKDQTIEIDLNGQPQNAKLAEGANQLREASFPALTFNDGANTLKVTVTAANGQKTTQTYTINVDTLPPTAVSDLAGKVADRRKGNVDLTWSAPSDGGNPSPTRYEVRYTSLLKAITEQDWDKPEGKIDLKATVGAGGQSAATLAGLSIGKTYLIAIRAKDDAGNLGGISNVITVSVDFAQKSTTEPGTGKTSFGIRLASGDFDKDGVQDVVACASAAADGAKNYVGIAYVYYGRKLSTGNYFPSKPDVTIKGEDTNHFFCGRVAGLGDLNGDGFDDFAVGSTRGGGGKGRVYIFFGGQRNTTIKDGVASSLARVIITGGVVGEAFGFRIDAVGYNGAPDFNGDKKVDLMISSTSKTKTGLTTKGAVYIFNSRAAYPTPQQPALQLTTADADITIVNNSEPSGSRGTAFFGYSLASGDLDGDGNADIIIAALGANSVIGWFGPLKPTNKEVNSSTASFKIDASATANETFGSSLAIVGDLDKDTKPELVISASRAQATGRPASSGQTWLFSGTKLIRGATKLVANTDAAASWYGFNTGTFLDRVVPAGDVNNDGYADFLLAEGSATSPTNGKVGQGAVYLFFGQKLTNYKSGLAADAASVVWWGSQAGSQLGLGGLLGGVDFDGDGFSDILLAETPPTTKTVLGGLYLYH